MILHRANAMSQGHTVPPEVTMCQRCSLEEPQFTIMSTHINEDDLYVCQTCVQYYPQCYNCNKQMARNTLSMVCYFCRYNNITESDEACVSYICVDCDECPATMEGDHGSLCNRCSDFYDPDYCIPKGQGQGQTVNTG